MPESRVKKSLLNARVNLIFYFLTLALSFFSRKIFLDCLGADFVGLTGTLQNLLGFLNLAELGIGSAIGYVLYKPLFDHDEAKINEIISVFGYLYRWIGRIILGAGCILACFLPLIFPDTQFELGIIFFAYFAFLVSSLIGYFANYKQTLLGADQKNYVVTAYFQTANIVKVLIQMASAYYTGSYYLWVAIELAFGIIYSFILNWKINQVYPWLRSEVKQGKQLFKKYPEVMKYTKQLFVHKIGGFVQFQTTPFLIYAFVSLPIVAIYQNYTLITSKLVSCLSNFYSSVGASIGNLIAEGNKKRVIEIYWELFSLRVYIAAFACISLYYLINPFIILWIGDDYLIDNAALILILINTFISIIRWVSEDFIFGYGLFWDIWAPIIEAIINLLCAIIGGYFWGLPGVLLGGVISLSTVILLWKPYLLFHWGFKISLTKYWHGFISCIVAVLIPIFGCQYIIGFISFNEYKSWINWIIYSIIVSLSYLIMAYISLYLLTPGMKSFTKRIITIIKNKFIL